MNERDRSGGRRFNAHCSAVLLAALTFTAAACSSSSTEPAVAPGEADSTRVAVTPNEPTLEANEAEPARAARTPTMREDVRFVSAELGRGLSEDWTLTDPTTVFELHDTIYVLITTDGSGPEVVLSAHWTYQDGQTVSRDDITFAPGGLEHAEFHVSKPDGWPTGGYQVEIFLDGKSVEVLDFRVDN